jgi:hypothetical protein
MFGSNKRKGRRIAIVATNGFGQAGLDEPKGYREDAGLKPTSSPWKAAPSRFGTARPRSGSKAVSIKKERLPAVPFLWYSCKPCW